MITLNHHAISDSQPAHVSLVESQDDVSSLFPEASSAWSAELRPYSLKLKLGNASICCPSGSIKLSAHGRRTGAEAIPPQVSGAAASATGLPKQMHSAVNR